MKVLIQVIREESEIRIQVIREESESAEDMVPLIEEVILRPLIGAKRAKESVSALASGATVVFDMEPRTRHWWQRG